MAHHLSLRVSLIAVVIAIVTSAVLLATTPDSEDIDSDCAILDFEWELKENLNPASLLENGHYLFHQTQPLPKHCIQMHVCQVNEFTRTHYSQSYYISLEKRGGAEIERQFPDLVEEITEQRGDERYIDLNNFCRAFEKRPNENGPPPNPIVPADRDPRERGPRPLNSNR